MLFLLREEGGFEGRMVGVDYSASSVELCRRVAGEKGIKLTMGGGDGGGEGEGKTDDGDSRGRCEDKGATLQFSHWNILTSPPLPSWPSNASGEVIGFDIVLDKGTFDAVSLSNELDDTGRRVVEGYRDRVEKLVRRGGWFVVTSCNWTEEELVGWFETPGGLERCGRVEYPVFRYGGRVGQSVWSVVFRRRG